MPKKAETPEATLLADLEALDTSFEAIQAAVRRMVEQNMKTAAQLHAVADAQEAAGASVN
ncbi:MAG: hypothetical protein AAFQ90_10590 [Pseudomonadota bacterium]